MSEKDIPDDLDVLLTTEEQLTAATLTFESGRLSEIPVGTPIAARAPHRFEQA